MRVEMAKPAASSLAELMRTPVDKRSIALERAVVFLDKEFCESNELTLVLMTDDMEFPLQMNLTKLTRNPIRYLVN